MNDFSSQPTKHPSVWISCGPGSERIDAVRRITNHSTGALGAALADAAALGGAHVTAWIGAGALFLPRWVDVQTRRFFSGQDLWEAWESQTDVADVIFHLAALGDYRVAGIKTADGDVVDPEGKIESRKGSLFLELEPAPKIITKLRNHFPEARIVGWKYETTGGRSEVVERGLRQLTEARTDACVLNGPAWGSGFGLLTSGGASTEFADRDALVSGLVARFIAR